MVLSTAPNVQKSILRGHHRAVYLWTKTRHRYKANLHVACMLQADAQTLGLLLLIQDILCAEERDTSHPCHVVTTVRRPQTIEVSYLC